MNFHFSPEAFFSCSSCGKCCSSGFEIPLRAEKAALIEASSTHRALLKEGYRPLNVLADAFHSLAYDQDGCCHYLDEKLCSLHRDQGLTHKPVICQLYPFNLVSTPDGTFVSLLFSCPAVMAGSGRPTGEHRQDLEKLFELHKGQVPHVAMLKEHLLLTNYATMTWREYQNWEAAFLESLDFENPVHSVICAAAHVLVADIESFQPSEISTELTMQHLPEFAQSVFEYLHGPTRTGWDTLEPVLKTPETALEKDSLRRYLLNQIHGKLLLIGPSLFCRLFLVAGAMNLILHEIRLGDPEVSEAEKVRATFEIYEENLVSQSNEIEPYLMALEEELLG